MQSADASLESVVRAACAAHGNAADALIEILHDLQDAQGHIAETALTVIANALNLSRADVSGVVSFYHDFRRAPPGRHVVKLCRAEACQSMGADALISHAESRLAVKLGGTTRDGAVTIEPTYCLGNCALAPAAMIDGELKGRVSPDRFDALIGVLVGSGRS